MNKSFNDDDELDKEDLQRAERFAKIKRDYLAWHLDKYGCYPDWAEEELEELKQQSPTSQSTQSTQSPHSPACESESSTPSKQVS